jgi:SDR family mycofactocin-dependent oxidoreductase
MGKFDGKVVLISGGARGQGRSHAVHFAREGASIVIFDIASQIDTVPYKMAKEDQLQETVRMVEDLDQRCVAIRADARDTAQVNGVVERTISEFGRLDILLVNHGILSVVPVADMSDKQWTDVIDTDLTGVFKPIRAAIPHMAKQKFGRIIATSSMAGRNGVPTIAHYSAAKWGVIGLCKSVAREVANEGITVNVMCPTNCDTDMIHNDTFYKVFAPGVDKPTREDVIPGFTSLNAIGIPWIEAKDVSNVALFLASDEARYITGEAIHVAAGWNAANAA